MPSQYVPHRPILIIYICKSVNVSSVVRKKKRKLKKELTINEGVFAEGQKAGGYESESFVIDLIIGEINQNV